MAAEINQQIYDGNKFQKIVDKLPHDAEYEQKKDDYEHKFTYDNYYSKRNGSGLWAIEIYYNVMIEGSEETESEYDILKNESDDPNAKNYLARI